MSCHSCILFNAIQTSLDNINPEVNEKYSAEFFKYFKEKLGVPGDRGYMRVYLQSIERSNYLLLI